MKETEKTKIICDINGNPLPLRMSRSAAMKFVNRGSKLFSEFLERHNITEHTFGESSYREYYTFDLYKAVSVEQSDKSTIKVH